ncbi:MAG: FemAB family PEP-CTERM system-associated protein [candidate division NC10 bacterium]|nr:FemAB family PEP-CTERM system-associated protein [candidate division NC10 bacterium]MDE2321224.1 FemAB family PEP-CTERM system-associated protein [candidate division NC10 bacterium]
MPEGTAIDVALLAPDQEKAWEDFVEASSHATFAHLLGWRNMVEKTYHHTPFYLMAQERGRVVGLLPLFLIESRIFGRFMVTAPYLSYGGLIADDAEASRSLVEKARELAIEQRVEYLEIRGSRRIDQGLILKDKYCTFVLSLCRGPKALWSRLEGRARKAVRKAMYSGLMVERGHSLVEAFAGLVSRHMRDLGTPFHRAIFYRNILAEFQNQSEILMVSHRGRPIGGVLLVTSKDTVFPLYGGALIESRAFSPMSLLIWETILFGCERGLAYLDFGRSRWDSGTFFFKRQWGAQPFPLFYEYHFADGIRMPDMDPTNPSFHVAVAIWKRLPAFMARALGPAIIRDIP